MLTIIWTLISMLLPFIIIGAIVYAIIMRKREAKEDAQEIENLQKEGKVKAVKINKVVRVSLSGGLIGAIFTNPRRALINTIAEHNKYGWNCHQIIPHSTVNLFVKVLQILVLFCTFGLWTWGAGYILLFEKKIEESSETRTIE